MNTQINPHGGELKNLLVGNDRALELKEISQEIPSITLTTRQICDLELLMNGAFSPLVGFMDKDDYESVVEDMHLADGSLWPIPITLDIPDVIAGKLDSDNRLGLMDEEGFMLAVLNVQNIWNPDK